MMTSVGLEPFILTHVLLPIGISFYIFESISYIIDVYRGDTRRPATSSTSQRSWRSFPHLIAGPVLRFRDLADQFNNRTHTLDKFSEGCTRFMQGFIKKVFIADTLAVVADHCFALQNPTTGDAWLGALAYTAQLYFDFSGYSDMAIGLGLMMGFRFMENFKQPYISQSITEFWRRWHISLSTWLRDYLYITLGGNRKGTLTTYRNLFLTMLLGGLWHGANITYIVWGAWHGMWLAIENTATATVTATATPLLRCQSSRRPAWSWRRPPSSALRSIFSRLARLRASRLVSRGGLDPRRRPSSTVPMMRRIGRCRGRAPAGSGGARRSHP